MEVFTNWPEFARSLPISDRLLFSICGMLSHWIPFWGFNLVLYFAYKHDWWMDVRIQGSAWPDPKIVNACLKKLVINHFIVQPLVVYSVLWPIFIACGGDFYSPFPSALTLAWQFAFFIMFNDTVFYWSHRFLHWKAIYKYIHKQHHEFKTTIGIAAEYAHPVEDVIANMSATLGGPLIVGAHPLVLWIWLIIRILETVEGHSGFAFRCSPFTHLDFLGGADRHDFHHSHNMGNFGSFFAFWDWICGTDQKYLEWREKNKKED